jgi:hypothetical protein
MRALAVRDCTLQVYSLYSLEVRVSPWATALASPYRAESKPILVAKIACYS